MGKKKPRRTSLCSVSSIYFERSDFHHSYSLRSDAVFTRNASIACTHVILVWYLKLCLISTSYSALIILKLTRVPPSLKFWSAGGQVRRGGMANSNLLEWDSTAVCNTMANLTLFFFGASSGVSPRSPSTIIVRMNHKFAIVLPTLLAAIIK